MKSKLFPRTCHFLHYLTPAHPYKPSPIATGLTLFSLDTLVLFCLFITHKHMPESLSRMFFLPLFLCQTHSHPTTNFSSMSTPQKAFLSYLNTHPVTCNLAIFYLHLRILLWSSQYLFFFFFFFFFFNFMAIPMAHGVPRSGIESKLQLQPMPQLWQCQIL